MSHVLVADDKEVMVNFLREFLTGEGHTVVAAADGREALSVRAESPRS
jgi:CheY-like chemotaxis protein